MAVSDLEKRIIRCIQGDLPEGERPYAVMAEALGITEKDLIERIRDLKARGIIRRFGATLRHQEAGFSSNAMVAWRVPEERVEAVGRVMAGFREVTHCYQRQPRAEWPYNLYTMVHGRSREECRRIAARLARGAGVSDYTLLFSEKEFKKTSMRYF